MRCVSAAGRSLRTFVLILAAASQSKKEEKIGLDKQDAVGADGEMRIDVGIWTGLSTNARDTNRPLLIQSSAG